MERRYTKSQLQRAAGDLNSDGLPLKFGGIAAVVDSATDMGWFEEEIAPGAFDEALADPELDVRCLYNHEECQVLGRTKSETCRLSLDSNGNLAYEYDADYRSPLHLMVGAAIDRRDVTQSSFAFTISEVVWMESAKYGPMGKRRITKIKKLYDVSPVTFPAYEDTEADSRSLRDERSKFLGNNGDAEKLQQQEIAHSLALLTLTKTK